jgi:hypothetical protein
MPEDLDYRDKKPPWYAQRRILYGGLVLFVATIGLSVLAFLKPVIAMAPDHPGIHVRNEGRLGASIHRVDGFWYWGGHVAILGNIPPIQQMVDEKAAPVKLQIPEMPSPDGYGIHREVCYMKLVVRYTISGIPIFRFTKPFYFVFDQKQQEWIATESIPPKHRALGNFAVGNVDKLNLNFH